MLKYVSRLQYLINPYSVWSSPVVFSCCFFRRVGSLTANTTCMRSPENLAKRACYLTSSRIEESPFSLKGPAEVRENYSLSQERFLFSHIRRPTSCQGLLGVSAFYLFYTLSQLQGIWSKVWVVTGTTGVEQCSWNRYYNLILFVGENFGVELMLREVYCPPDYRSYSR